MRFVPLLALWPALAEAQDVTRFAWGAPVNGSAPSGLSLEPCHLPCVAVVRFDNTLVTTGASLDVPVRATLAISGLRMLVTVENGMGLTPDLLRVRPPPGTAAEPHEVLVDDNATGRVRVVLAPTS
ncbi:hypothetical protein [Rubellimicrobium aerolatum]|uniref:Copper chaperone PCu(A)C n=1 Tax=Rubellimicrobium aerolatum TaxID=490979 RepID=A0ABW0S924_9RHOB|nr:hypothetical protein [Rubellimicrobium aerolatum]MBP1804783.1 hypothetical protein [Rubellimicrobium aerolatum]